MLLELLIIYLSNQEAVRITNSIVDWSVSHLLKGSVRLRFALKKKKKKPKISEPMSAVLLFRKRKTSLKGRRWKTLSSEKVFLLLCVKNVCDSQIKILTSNY